MRFATILTVVTVFAISACAGSKISTSVGKPPSQSINTIAMAPESGMIAEAVAVEMFNRGFSVVEAAQTAAVADKLGIREAQLSLPDSMKQLKGEGIDAVLIIKGVAGHDSQPQSASVRMVDTSTGQVISGFSWQNGWGGMSGSIADRAMRADMAEVADEISDELESRLR